MSAPPLDPREFRELMGRWATGVTVVTARDGGVDHGMTVNAFLSVSTSPPILLVSLMREADATPVVERTKVFGVSVLSAQQRSVSERFARTVSPAEKFAGAAIRRGSTGVALIEGATATFECRVREAHPAGDHLLMIGEVTAAEAGMDESPLLFFRSHYAEPSGRTALTLPPP